MSPRRDPQTGKFVAGGGGGPGWDDTKVLTATIHTEIPAADLSGGTDTVRVDGTEARLINLDDLLDHDEQYQVHAMAWEALLALPTTATAESYARLAYAVGKDSEDFLPQTMTPVFWGGAPDEEVGTVDISQDHADRKVWYHGELEATNSVVDSTNTLGAGGDHDRFRTMFGFGPDGPKMDDTDELYVPHEWHVDNISDHAVIGTFRATLYGSSNRT